MIIKSLMKHFPARSPEWISGFTLFAWGSYLLLHPGMFGDPRIGLIFQGMQLSGRTLDQSQTLWGYGAAVVGMLRLCALFVNGAYTRTPAIRLLTGFFSAFVWTQVVLGLLNTGIPNTGLVMYSSALLADLYSAYNAGGDFAYAERQRRVKRAEQKSVSSLYTAR